MEIEMLKRAALDPIRLAQFTGSEHFFRHGLVCHIVFTEGVKYVADAAGAYWLLDEIALAQKFQQSVMAEDFQVWDLRVVADRSAVLVCGDRNGHEVCSKRIKWTDFSTPSIRFYVCNGTILLPCEY
jgi:hypothetical protein